MDKLFDSDFVLARKTPRQILFFFWPSQNSLYELTEPKFAPRFINDRAKIRSKTSTILFFWPSQNSLFIHTSPNPILFFDFDSHEQRVTV